jgi:nitrile hydratase
MTEPALRAGDRVLVRAMFPPGHVRTPFYIRGKRGVVERVLAVYPDPEERAYGRPGVPGRRLYRIRFRQAEVWSDYSGSPADTLDVELFEHWLQAE